MGKVIDDKTFKNKVKELVGNEYIFHSEYKGRHNKIPCTHQKCGYTWEVEAGAFLGNKNKKGSRCPNCYGNKKRTTKDFGEQVKKITNGEYELVSEYVRTKTKVSIKHLECGKTYKIVPYSFINGNRCPYCSKSKPYTQKTAEEKIRSMSNDEFKLISEYKGCYEKLTLRHDNCGKTYQTTMQLLSRGINCPHCNPKSKMEVAIKTYLNKKDIKFEEQVRFEDLPRLSYDFYLPDHNILIEYQGEQHFKPIKYFGGDSVFKKQITRDKRKKSYADKNMFYLLDIPYTYNTQEKVEKFLNLYFNL